MWGAPTPCPGYLTSRRAGCGSGCVPRAIALVWTVLIRPWKNACTLPDSGFGGSQACAAPPEPQIPSSVSAGPSPTPPQSCLWNPASRGGLHDLPQDRREIQRLARVSCGRCPRMGALRRSARKNKKRTCHPSIFGYISLGLECLSAQTFLRSLRTPVVGDGCCEGSDAQS